MSEHNTIIVAGYAGHGLTVAEAAIMSGMGLKHYCDRSMAASNPFGLNYAGFEGDSAFKYWEEDCSFVLGIGDNELRMKVAERITSFGKHMLNVTHPSASISRTATLGSGIMVGAHVVVNPMARIGSGAILNTRCIVEHGCQVGAFSHIAPGAVLLGDVHVGSRVLVGANAVVRQGLRIADGAIIGMGAVVTKDVQANEVVVGNPANTLRRNG